MWCYKAWNISDLTIYSYRKVKSLFHSKNKTIILLILHFYFKTYDVICKLTLNGKPINDFLKIYWHTNNHIKTVSLLRCYFGFLRSYLHIFEFNLFGKYLFIVVLSSTKLLKLSQAPKIMFQMFEFINFPFILRSKIKDGHYSGWMKHLDEKIFEQCLTHATFRYHSH